MKNEPETYFLFMYLSPPISLSLQIYTVFIYVCMPFTLILLPPTLFPSSMTTFPFTHFAEDQECDARAGECLPWNWVNTASCALYSRGPMCDPLESFPFSLSNTHTLSLSLPLRSSYHPSLTLSPSSSIKRALVCPPQIIFPRSIFVSPRRYDH